jgi:hypothetical protein
VTVCARVCVCVLVLACTLSDLSHMQTGAPLDAASLWTFGVVFGTSSASAHAVSLCSLRSHSLIAPVGCSAPVFIALMGMSWQETYAHVCAVFAVYSIAGEAIHSSVVIVRCSHTRARCISGGVRCRVYNIGLRVPTTTRVRLRFVSCIRHTADYRRFVSLRLDNARRLCGVALVIIGIMSLL